MALKKITDPTVNNASAFDGTETFPVTQAGETREGTLSAIKTMIGDPQVRYGLGAAFTNSTVTPQPVTGWQVKSVNTSLTVGVGLYAVTGLLLVQSVATTTGFETFFRHNGTVNRCLGLFIGASTGGAAATGVAVGSTSATAAMAEAKAQRSNNTATGTWTGVDVINVVIPIMVNFQFSVTASGTLDLMFRSEVAASQVTLGLGSYLIVDRLDA
jgi:hypothetical protein